MTDRGTYALLEELDAAKHAGRSVVPSALAERYGVALDRVLRLAAGLGALEALTGPERASVAEPNPKSAVEGVWRETVGSGEGIDPQQSCRPASFAPFGAADSAESSLYRLEEEIGRGGMGVVYKAEQSRLRRPVAVKQLPRGERSSDQTRAFFAEALTAAWLDHPNIIPVYDMEGSSSSNGAALLMKLVEGESWLSLLHPETEEQKALAADYDLAAHLQVFLQVCNGVAFAHSRGIAHLDLKPENVMVGAFGEVLVVDWGLAVDVRDRPSSERRARPRAWFHLNPAGTPSYMAPEMALGRASHIGAWTDVYLLGATLYHVLAGRPPHRGGDVWETLLTAARSEPDPLPEEHPEELREICGRALARQPRRRFQSVETFQAAIREFLEHRESVRLADEARVTLGECQVARARGAALSDGDRRRLYSDHARALFGFERAQALWQDNATAEVGQRDAQRSYAQSALTLGDLGLAEALVDELGDDREAEPLLESVREERRGKKRAVKQQRRVRLALRGTIGLIVFGVIGGVFLSQQLERGARQEQLATTLAEAREEAGRAADAFSRARAEPAPNASDAEARRRWTDRQLSLGMTALARSESAVTAARSAHGVSAEETERAVAVAFGLGEVALVSEQWSVAAGAVKSAESLGADPKRAREALARVEAGRLRVSREHRELIQDTLSKARQGSLLVKPGGYEDAVFRLVALRESQTATLLGKALDEISVQLDIAVRDELATAETPTPIERASGSKPIEGLKEALARAADRPLGTPLPPKDLVLIYRATQRLVARVGRERTADARSKRLQVGDYLGSLQKRKVGPGPLHAAQLCVKVLGRLGIREGAVEPLIRYLAAERDPIRAARAGVALCLLGGLPAEEAVLRGADRFGRNSPFWRQVSPYLGRTGVETSLSEESARGYRTRGQILAAKGNHADARRDFERALELDPEDALTWLAYGSALERLKEVDAALEAYQRSGEKDPTLALAWNNRVSIRVARGEIQEALREVSHAIELRPDLGLAWANRATIKEMLRDFEGALADASQAILLQPDLVEAWRTRGSARRELGQLASALADYDQALRLDETSAESLSQRGLVHQALGDHDKALADFTRAIEVDPTSANAWANRGQLHLRRGDLDGALSDTEQALEIDERSTAAWSNRATIETALGLHKQALASATRATEIDPRSPEAWGTLGIAHSSVGRKLKAIEAFSKAIELDPKQALSWANRGLARFSVRQIRGALTDFEKALQLDPKLPQAYKGRADIFAAAGMLERALADLNRTVALEPKSTIPLRSRAFLLRRMKRYAEAAADLTRAIEMNPDDGTNWYFRARVRELEGKNKEALADFGEGLKRNPNYLNGWGNRGLLRKRLGDYEGAVKDFTRVIQLRPRLLVGYMSRGEAYAALEEHEKAVVDFSKATKLQPRNPTAWRERGKSRRALGRLKGALKDLGQALGLAAGDGEASYERALVHEAQGNLDGARADLKRALATPQQGATYVEAARAKLKALSER